MTTMNNVMNTTTQLAYMHLRCTFLNGESWELFRNVSALSEEEVALVIDCLVNGYRDDQIHTPQSEEFITSIMNHAAEVLTLSCFEGRKYKHSYALELISQIQKVGLCCEDCFIQEVTTLHQLIAEHKAGNKTAGEQIVQNLYMFFVDTMPFVFDVI